MEHKALKLKKYLQKKKLMSNKEIDKITGIKKITKQIKKNKKKYPKKVWSPDIEVVRYIR